MKLKKRIIISIFFIIFLIMLCGFSAIVLYQRENKKDIVEMDFFPVEICCGTDYLFFIGKRIDLNNVVTYSTYKMNKNNFNIEEVGNFDISNNILFKKITALHDCFYIIVQNKLIYEIWKISDIGEVIEIYDISRFLNPYRDEVRYFCIDNQERYYIRNGLKPETIIIDLANGTEKRVEDTSVNVSFESMTVGTNGNIIMLFCRNKSIGGGYEIIEFVDTQMKTIYSGDLLPYEDIYSVMGTGNDKYEVLIKGTNAVYGYSKDKNGAEFIESLSLKDYEYTKSCFIDGIKLLVFGANPMIEKEKIISEAKLLLYKLGE